MDPKAIDYPLYDVTSSGANQGSKKCGGCRNRTGIGSGHDPRGQRGVVAIELVRPDPTVALKSGTSRGRSRLKETVPLSLLRPGSRAVAALPHKPGAGSISPRKTLKKVGEKVIVEMQVQATGQPKAGKLFLNSERDYRSDLNLTVVVNAAAVMTGKWAKATPDTFKGKVIRVTGTVSDFRGSPQIVVDDESQIELLGGD